MTHSDESWFKGKWSSPEKEKIFMNGSILLANFFVKEVNITALHIGKNITDLGHTDYAGDNSFLNADSNE
ncbi:MAG: hypothetical protein HRT99_04045 [Mycoplasmatales bacterium]|nr:hypothetical protein [Mycoplasmatales bacterium]